MEKWGINSRGDVNEDVVKRNVENLFRNAIGSLVGFLTPMQTAVRRMQAALADPALGKIDPITASYLEPSLQLNIPPEFQPNATIAAQLAAAMPPEAQRAYAEVRAATTLLGARACNFVNELKEAIEGKADWFSIKPLAEDLRNSTTNGTNTSALNGTCVQDCTADSALPDGVECFANGTAIVPCTALLVDDNTPLIDTELPDDAVIEDTDGGDNLVLTDGGGRRRLTVYDHRPLDRIPHGRQLQVFRGQRVLVPHGRVLISLSGLKNMTANITSKLTVENLQYALSNVSAIITKVQGFITLILDGPAAAQKLTDVLTEKLEPALGALQNITDKYINPAILTVRDVLRKVANASALVMGLVSNSTDFGRRIGELIDYGMEKLGTLINDKLASNAKTANSNSSFLARIASVFNSSQDLLDNGLKKIEDFLLNQVGKFSDRLNNMAERAAAWVARGITPMLVRIRPTVVRLKDWVKRNKDKMKLLDVFTQMATGFAEMVRDLPFGDKIVSAVKKVVEFAGNRKDVTALIDKILDIIDKLMTGDGILDVIWSIIDASGVADSLTAVTSGRLLAARTIHARRMAEMDRLAPEEHPIPAMYHARQRMLRTFPNIQTDLAASHARLLAMAADGGLDSQSHVKVTEKHAPPPSAFVRTRRYAGTVQDDSGSRALAGAIHASTSGSHHDHDDESDDDPAPVVATPYKSAGVRVQEAAAERLLAAATKSAADSKLAAAASKGASATKPLTASASKKPASKSRTASKSVGASISRTRSRSMTPTRKFNVTRSPSRKPKANRTSTRNATSTNATKLVTTVVTNCTTAPNGTKICANKTVTSLVLLVNATNGTNITNATNATALDDDLDEEDLICLNETEMRKNISVDTGEEYEYEWVNTTCYDPNLVECYGEFDCTDACHLAGAERWPRGNTLMSLPLTSATLPPALSLPVSPSPQTSPCLTRKARGSATRTGRSSSRPSASSSSRPSTAGT